MVPADKEVYEEQQQFTFLHALILGLSIFIVIALAIDEFFELPPPVTDLINIYDNVLCAVFFVDFVIRFFKAPDKKLFMKWGWLQLLSCLPALGGGTYLSAVRMLRILRIILVFQIIKVSVKQAMPSLGERTLLFMASGAITLTMLSSMAILLVETAPNSNIDSASDSLWWYIVTIATVGYGDLYPVTNTGRLIGGVLIFSGVSVFATFAGYLSSQFSKKRK